MKKELIKNMVSLIVGEALLEFIENPTSPNIVNDLREKYSEKILSVIDSLQEEPVSEDEENALNSVAITFLQEQQIVPNFYADIIMKAVKRGANWQKQQMMKEAIERTVKIDAGGYPYIDCDGIELYDYDKDIPLAKEGEKYKVILIKEI